MFKKNPKLAVSYIFAPMGALMLMIPSYLLFTTYTFSRSGTKIEGEVSEINYQRSSDDTSYTYYPTISYSIDGEEKVYVSRSGQNPSPYEIGDKVNLLIDKDSGKIAIDSFVDLYLGLVIPMAIGTLMLTIAANFYISEKRKAELFSRLSKFGNHTSADFVSVTRSNLVVNGNYSYLINAKLVDPRSGKVMNLQSDHIWFDPTSYIPADHKIPVLLDPKDSNINMVDTSFLPKHV